MPSSQRVPHAIATNQQTCWNNTPSWWIKTLLGTLSHSCVMVPSLVVPSKHRQAPSPTAWVRLDLYFPPRPGLEWWVQLWTPSVPQNLACWAREWKMLGIPSMGVFIGI